MAGKFQVLVSGKKVQSDYDAVKVMPHLLFGVIDVFVVFTEQHIVQGIVEELQLGEVILADISYPAAAQHKGVIVMAAEGNEISFLLSFVKRHLNPVVMMSMAEIPQRVNVKVEAGNG